MSRSTQGANPGEGAAVLARLLEEVRAGNLVAPARVVAQLEGAFLALRAAEGQTGPPSQSDYT